MPDDPSCQDVDPGETIEVDGNGEEISLPTKTTRRRKHIDDHDDDDEEPMPIHDKVHLGIALFIMFIIIFGLLYLSWWWFGEFFFKAASSRVPRRGPATPAPSPVSSGTCTMFQQLLSRLGIISGC